MSELEGRTTVVTGSSKGIGKRIVERFYDEGANVVVNSRSRDRAEAVLKELPGSEGRAIAIAADVGDPDAVTRLVDETVDEFGRIDVLINNAGRTIIGPATEFTPDQWQAVLDVNLTGVFFCAQAAARHMIEQGGGGHVITISSMLGEQGLQGRAPYCATKGAVNNLTRTLAVEWAEHEIYVNAVAPGFIRTDITEQTQDDAGYTDDDIRKRTPLRRFGTLDEIANCVAFLAAGDHYITGEVLRADGGWTAFGWGRWDE